MNYIFTSKNAISTKTDFNNGYIADAKKIDGKFVGWGKEWVFSPEKLNAVIEIVKKHYGDDFKVIEKNPAKFKSIKLLSNKANGWLESLEFISKNDIYFNSFGGVQSANLIHLTAAPRNFEGILHMMINFNSDTTVRNIDIEKVEDGVEVEIIEYNPLLELIPSAGGKGRLVLVDDSILAHFDNK